MTVQELFDSLHQLDTADKFKAVQLLLKDLAIDEDKILNHGGDYELWSQYDSADAAAQLMRMMREEEQRSHG
jgi:hypothetical protein